MQRYRIFWILALTLCYSGSRASEPNDGLNWLLGCWTSSDGSSREVWVRQSDQLLIGFGVAIAQDQVVFHEVLSIRIENDGNVNYTAHANGQQATTFSAKLKHGNEIVFVNPQHDFPQTVAHRLDGDQLHATISLLDGGNPVSFDKVRCAQVKQ